MQPVPKPTGKPVHFRRLVVCLDGTPEAAVALPPARALAQATGAELVLVRVVAPQMAYARSPEVAEAEAYLDRIAVELRAGVPSVATIVRQADTAALGILAEAAARDADLIVLTTHGRSGLARAVRGSVADAVLAEARVPVMLVRPGGHRLAAVRTLLVPVDGSPGAAVALATAVALARTTGARLALVQVAVPLLYAYMTELPPGLDPAWEDEAAASAERYVQGLARRLNGAGLTAEGYVARGTPSAGIRQVADQVDADVIVMSTHALTGPARTLLGSVADELVRTAQRPVLLTRRSHT